MEAKQPAGTLSLDQETLSQAIMGNMNKLFMERFQANAIKLYPTQNDLAQLSNTISTLAWIRAKVNLSVPFIDPEETFITVCSHCQFPDTSSAVWTPACQHSTCRVCIHKLLEVEFKGDVKTALEQRVFCPTCRKDKLHQKQAQFVKDIEDWNKRHPKLKSKKLNQSFLDAQPDDSDDQSQEKIEEEQKDPPPKSPGPTSQIRQSHLAQFFPQIMKRYDLEKQKERAEHLVLLEKAQRQSRHCEECNEIKKNRDFISLTPCSHSMCKECLQKKWGESVQNQEVDRECLVCPTCQGYVHIINIKSCFSDKPGYLKALLNDKEYNNYSSQKECPQCSRLLFWDQNHQEQRCNECSYQFCSLCYLPTHNDLNSCAEAVKRRRDNLKLDDKIQESQLFSVCQNCFTYGRKVFGSEVASCQFCKKYFCSKCKTFVSGAPCCDVQIPDIIMTEIAEMKKKMAE